MPKKFFDAQIIGTHVARKTYFKLLHMSIIPMIIFNLNLAAIKFCGYNYFGKNIASILSKNNEHHQVAETTAPIITQKVDVIEKHNEKIISNAQNLKAESKKTVETRNDISRNNISDKTQSASNANILKKLSWPIENKVITSEYGHRDGKTHNGIDITSKSKNQNIMAACAGVVEFAGQKNNGYGKYVILNHGENVRTLYAHCSNLLIKEGEVVNKGQTIAIIGNSGDATGKHLHFEVQIHNISVNPKNFLKQ